MSSNSVKILRVLAIRVRKTDSETSRIDLLRVTRVVKFLELRSSKWQIKMVDDQVIIVVPAVSRICQDDFSTLARSGNRRLPFPALPSRSRLSFCLSTIRLCGSITPTVYLGMAVGRSRRFVNESLSLRNVTGQ